LALYARACGFLLKTQNKNGSWGMDPATKKPGELGITGLIVLGLAEAPAESRGKYMAACEKSAAWIVKHQKDDGSITQERSGLTTYRTALGIMALKAIDGKRYAGPIAKGMKWLAGSQFVGKKDNPHFGGWGYDKSGTKPDADLSNTHIALQALKAAGMSEDDPVFKRALAFVTRCQNNSETNKGVGKLKPMDDGGMIYDPGLSRNKSMPKKNPDGTTSYESYASMTYAGLMSLLTAKIGKDDPRVKAAVRWIKEHYTLESNYGLGTRNPKPKADQQGLFYYYMTFAKALDLYGEPHLETKSGKRHWPSDLCKTLAKSQAKDGSWINAASPRWWEGNPLVPTAYVVNALNRALKHIAAKK